MGAVTEHKRLGEFARTMRNDPAPMEKRIWNSLSRSQLGGHRFRRQHVIDQFVVDFFCPEKALVVEIDGDTHEAERDRIRDINLKMKGYTVIRFTNCEVQENLIGVLDQILTTADRLPCRWQAGRPHPNPSPEGEGQ